MKIKLATQEQLENVKSSAGMDIETKQDKLTAGENITIDPVTNTISGTAQYDDTQIKADIDTKQDKLIAGDNIQILDNEISAVDTIYDDSGIKADIDTKQDKLIAGANVQIDDASNTISATDTTYGNATTSRSGLMSAEDKGRLDSLDEEIDKKLDISKLTFIEDGVTYLGKFVIDNGQPKIVAEEVI